MISVIAPAYNNPKEVKGLLESISLSKDLDFPFEVIIVDDGSSDGSIEAAVKPFSFTRYMRLDTNSGAAVARNTGAKAARYDRLFFVDSDITVFPDTLAKVKRYFDNSNVEAFIGHLDMVPQNDGFFPRYKAMMFNSWLPEEGHSTVFTPAVGGIRKEAFFKCGGFDEAIRGATVEYLKFSYALRENCTIYFYPDLVVRVKINSFWKALYTDFYSTMKWVTIFDKYRKFDNHCTTVSGGLGRLLGFVCVVTLPVCLVLKLYLLWAFIFAIFFYLNRRFFLLVLKKESFLFLFGALATYMVLSIPTIFGGIAGLALVITKRIKDIFEHG